MSIKQAVYDWCTTRQPSRFLRLLSLPIGHQIKTDWTRFENARMVDTAFGLVHNNHIQGDYLEFGVFRGSTFGEAWHAARRRGLDIRFHAFDSFEGLPEVKGKDIGGPFVTGEFSTSRASFEKTLKKTRVDMNRVTITQGFFDQTLTADCAEKLGIKQAAVVWIDCDLYESTVPVLKFLTDLLVDGSVICFDDWYCYNGHPDRGEPLACAEWLAENPDIKLVEYHKFHWAGQSFIVNRR